jgi:hypothetical protein
LDFAVKNNYDAEMRINVGPMRGRAWRQKFPAKRIEFKYIKKMTLLTS